MNTVRKLALSVALVSIFTMWDGGSVLADGVVGEKWTVGNYCARVDLDFIRQFTDVVVRGGYEAYMTIVSRPNGPCYDVRVHGIDPAQVILKERMWGFTLPDGEELVMWRVEDANGVQGYTWLSPDQDHNKNTGQGT